MACRFGDGGKTVSADSTEAGGGGALSLPEKIVLWKGRHLHFVARGSWEYVERPGITGLTAIVPLTPNGEIVLVEQHRPPVGRPVIELPAGLAGDVPGEEGERLVDAARRELLEETGFDAGELILLTEGASSAGLTDEVISFFAARKLRRVSAGGGDASEAITVHEVPLEQAHDWLEERRRAGALVDLKVYAGLYFARRLQRE
ncbi:MAG: NUDIX hydrolase [Planctomycetes bacterium]|nr:NUDIX hydrolase [Planctomycetota bacterium]